ncbi:AI-2E family transporter [Kribbella qitaiheensis]|uniref:AI-2E family transporter n=1 Tax=Kribbella qitaiheensis TaxID=1544730 RepID=UPI00360E6CDE
MDDRTETESRAEVSTRVTTRPTTKTARGSSAAVFRWAAVGTLGVLTVLLCAYGLYTIRSILVLVLIALFLAVSLDPAVQWLLRLRLGLRRSTAVTIISLVVVVMVAGFMWSVVPAIVNQTGMLLADLPGYLRTLSDESKVVREITDRYDLTDRLSALVAGIPAKLAGGAIGFVRSLIGTAASTITVLVLTVYFMADLPRVREGLPRLFPSRRRRVAEITDVVVEKVGGYMIGNLTISLIAGVAAYVCLTLVGVPFALPLAAAVAIADLIPMVGATLGAVICLVVSLFAVGIWPRTVIVLIFFILYQQAENYLIAPRVLRNTVNMSSAAVLLVALIGGSLFGVVGAIMAIPVAAAVKVLVYPGGHSPSTRHARRWGRLGLRSARTPARRL